MKKPHKSLTQQMVLLQQCQSSMKIRPQKLLKMISSIYEDYQYEYVYL